MLKFYQRGVVVIDVLLDISQKAKFIFLLLNKDKKT